ncbi:MAG: Hpt domain-containing protein [Syntrophales bacterium]
MKLRRLASRLGLEESEFKEILKLFIETSNTDLKNLRCAIESGDARKAFEASHSIKGAAENLGFLDISGIARGIEMKARQDILEGSSEAVYLLKQKIEKIAAFI